MTLAWLCLALAAAGAAHPLDPLTPEELSLAAELVRGSGKAGGDPLFPLVALEEPPKAALLSWREGASLPREAKALAYDRGSGRAFEGVVDLRGRKLRSWKLLEGVQPPVMLSEFDELPAVVKADPRWAEALARRGIRDPEEAAVDVWAYGTPPAGGPRRRLLRALAYHKGGGKNFYARPIEGLSAVLDADARKVLEVLDTAVLPLPPETAELDEASLGPARPALAPLELVQKVGPGFRLEGNRVRWGPWSFRFSMHPREGLVLHQVGYEDGGRLRPVLHRASLSEMMVPYGHSDPQWTFRSAFDEGEYGIGRYSGPLEPGVDVPGNAVLLDADFADDRGRPYRAERVVALYERDGGLLWRHFDMYEGERHSRRGRELAVFFVTTISNYDYGLAWVFKEDGSLELEASLTGIMLAKGTRLKEEAHGSEDPDARMAHLVAPHVAAPHHQHFFSFRLDLDVDGAGGNRAYELDARPLPRGERNPDGNAFEMVETPIGREGEGGRDLSFAAQRKWKVVQEKGRNRLGGHPGFLLVPGENSLPYLAAGHPLLERGGFVRHHVWLTRYQEGELYAAGPYPNQRSGEDGLPVWSRRDRSLDGEDLVLWYTFGITHAPRPEEWPVMPVHKAGFKLLPAGFFGRNPALDLPARR